MAQKYPLKLREYSPGKYRSAEFELSDFVGVNDGGTGATNAVDALSNLGGIPLTQKAASNGVCPLDGGLFVPEVHLPDSFKPQVYNVANVAARLALTVQEGDEAIQSDDNSHWIYNGSAWLERPGHKILLADGVTLKRLVRD